MLKICLEEVICQYKVKFVSFTKWMQETSNWHLHIASYSEKFLFTTSAKVSSSLKLQLFVFFMLIIFFLINECYHKFSIFSLNQITYFINIISATFTLFKNGFSNKKETKLYKFSRRSKTMIGVPLNKHVRAIFQSDKYQNILIIIALIYRTEMER